MLSSVVALALAAQGAAENPMKICGAKYQAAKTAKSLPAGQTWPQFLSTCRGGLPKAADAPAAKSASAQPTAGQTAARGRMQQCAAKYRADKAAGKLAAGQSWPGYYSACSKALKASSA